MHCDQVSEMMSARLDARLDGTQMALLEEHLAACSACLVQWRRMQALHGVLASAPMVRAPLRLRMLVLARLERRERTRRAIIGSTTLALGTVTLALLALAPAALNLLSATGIAPALISGGPETLVQFVALLSAVGRALLVLAERLAVPLALLSLCGLATALALNSLWIGAVRRLSAAR